MKIRIQSIKFDADQKLLDFVERKFEKVERFLDNIQGMDVALIVEPEHKKKVKVIVNIPGDDLVIERVADTFEDAVVDCADVMKDQLVKIKEKRFGK